ncbi:MULTISPECIES: hypothetical protein [Alphaproteobacteria]|uniref:hypothetical protein n=1 Tax=Alphaproteobacteria TaxID=28211 RepID=UPI003298C6E7
MTSALVATLAMASVAFPLFYPQEIRAQEQSASVPPGCDVPRGYDCATPGFEMPLSLDEAIELSQRETVVYLYGPGLQGSRIVARLMRKGENATPIPAVAAPGVSVPRDTFYVAILGKLVKHRASGEPVEFYQRFINRGEVFSLTREMHTRIVTGD